MDETAKLVEAGLGATRTKVGPGNKEDGYSIRATRLKAFLAGVAATVLTLAILVAVYAIMFQNERVRGMMAVRKSKQETSAAMKDKVRLGFAVEQLEAERAMTERDVSRALNRINVVLHVQLETLKRAPPIAQAPDSVKLINDLAQQMGDYIRKEMTEVEKEIKDSGDVDRLRLVASMQESTLRDLLKTFSGIKMNALRSMLEEVFTVARKSPDLPLSPSQVTDLERIADRLYEGNMDIKEGATTFERTAESYRSKIPKAALKAILEAKTPDEMGEAIDSLCDIARMNTGRGAIADIERKWRMNMEQLHERHSAEAHEAWKKGEDMMESLIPAQQLDEELEADVDAILAVHSLIADGQVPTHLLDFSLLHLHFPGDPEWTMEGDPNADPAEDAVEKHERMAKKWGKADKAGKGKHGKSHDDSDDDSDDEDEHGSNARAGRAAFGGSKGL